MQRRPVAARHVAHARNHGGRVIAIALLQTHHGSVQLVGARPMNVFQCETCDKLAAVAATDASMAGESDRNNTARA